MPLLNLNGKNSLRSLVLHDRLKLVLHRPVILKLPCHFSCSTEWSFLGNTPIPLFFDSPIQI